MRWRRIASRGVRRGDLLRKSRQRSLEQLETRCLLAGDLIAHWVADDLDSGGADVAPVTEWVDSVAGREVGAIGTPLKIANSIGGRASVQFDPSDGDDGFRLRSTNNPLVRADDFSVLVAFRTDSTSLVGQQGDWYNNTGLVDSNAMGFSRDWGLSINAAGQLSAGMGAGFGMPTTTLYSSAGQLNDGQLHIAVVSRSGTDLSLYVDDQPAQTRNDAADGSLASLDLTFGILQSEKNPFPGEIAQVRLYDGSLSAQEVGDVVSEVTAYYSNQPPVAQDDAYSLSEDTGLFLISAEDGVLKNDSDPDGDLLTAEIVTSTQHGELGLNAQGSFIYTPDADFFGTDQFTYTANDFRPGNTATVTLQVQPTYDAASAAADRYELLPGQITEVAAAEGLLINDLNPDQGMIRAVLAQDVSAGDLTLREDGSFGYDPGAFFGTTTFTYSVDDGTTVSPPATVTLVVNSAPTAADDQYEVHEDSVLDVAAAEGLLANDFDAEGDSLTINLTSQPENGLLELQPDGALRYVPLADYFGSDEFTYVLSDGLLESQPATVRLEVLAVNDLPQAVGDTYAVLLNESLEVSAEEGLLRNDTDLDGPELIAELAESPLRGTLQLQSDGSFTYAPEPGFIGRDWFTYRLSDSVAQTDPVMVHLIVHEETYRTTDPTGDSIVTFNEIMYNPVRSSDEELEWVEVHNQMAINMDLTGWRLSGGMAYQFPDGTVIPGNGYLVVAANPEALQEATGFAEALGPFEGRLDNAGEEIELRNNSNRIMDILDYGDRDRWPVGPDGSGATLAKRSVHLATAEARSWTTSDQMEGTPGAENFPAGETQPATVLLNELSAAWANPFLVELVNTSSEPLELEGYTLYSSANENRRFEFASQTLSPGGLLSVDLSPSGIRAGNGDRVFLLAPGGDRVVDAEIVMTPLRGRSPAHDQRWMFPDQPTFGQSNSFQIEDRIVINELMYHAPGYYSPQLDRIFDNTEEWIELYNRSENETVDLSGWTFSEAMDFQFPEGTTLPPNSYLVISNDPENLLLTRPDLPPAQVLGPFTRRLANGGETIVLADQVGNVVDEVRYYDSGRWPSEADALAASLELRNPHSDNSIPEAWAASDEFAGGSWQTITVRGVGSFPSSDPQQYNEFLLGLLDDGEVLIDDVQVIENPDTPDARQIIQNGHFEGDDTGADVTAWRIIGNHSGEVIVDPDHPDNHVLRLVADGPTEHMHNHAETTLKDGDDYVRLDRRAEYEVSFRARWVSGSNQLNSRLYFNRLGTTTRLNRPLSVGTPGQVNSRFEENIGPTYTELIHAPAVPSETQPVTVSVFADDPQGVQQLSLWYSVDGSDFLAVPMNRENSGVFQGIIPAQASDSLVQFYLTGEDGSGAVSVYPAAGPESRALYRVQDGQANDDQRHSLRILMTPEDTDRLHEVTNVMSNGRLGATVIYREQEIFYDVGVRLKGSQRGRAKDVRVGFNLRFDPSQPFRGVHETIGVDRSGSGDEYSQEEIIVRQILNHAGNLPQIYDDLIHVIAPNSRHTGSAMLNMARYNDVFLDSQFENGSQGTAFEYELIYYPTSTTGGPEGLKRPNPDSVVGTPLRNIGDEKELYRYHWIIKNNRKEDDYSQLMLALDAIGRNPSSDPDYHTRTQQLLDVDQWLRSFAVQSLAGIGDNYTGGAQHNAIFYVRPTDGKMLFLPWDMDFSFTQGVTSGLTSNGDLNKLLRDPGNEHAYYGHVYDIVQTTFHKEYMDPWIDHFDELVPGQNFFRNYKSYIDRRSTHAMSLVERAVPVVPFEITTAGPMDVGDSVTAAVEGTGWVDVRQIRVAGENVPLPITWLTENQWQLQIPVAAGTREVELEAYDFQGEFIATDTITITSTAAAPVRDHLRISELHYNPAGPVDGELPLDNDEFEFVELINTGPEPLDLVGVRFVYVERNAELEGIEFTFDSQMLAPGARLVVPGNRDAFLSRYGDQIPLAAGSSAQDTPGAFTGRLDNGGEMITVLDVTGAIVQQFAYDDDWYAATDGDGPTLEVLDPTEPDPESWGQAASWSPSSFSGGTPGQQPVIPGDANLDGVFDEQDVVAVMQIGEYEDDLPGNSTWEEGDWDGDGDFTTNDFVLAFQSGWYRATAVAATPATADRRGPTVTDRRAPGDTVDSTVLPAADAVDALLQRFDPPWRGMDHLG